MFATALEHQFTKNEILELYLNKVYFGNGLYGAEAASRGYFGKKASELSLGEASLLAGTAEGAVELRPVAGAAESRSPADRRLEGDARQQGDYQGQFDTAIKDADRNLRWAVRAEEPYGQYFKDEVRRQLVEQFGNERVEQGGLKVYTTMDPYMQRAADAVVDREHRGD